MLDPLTLLGMAAVTCVVGPMLTSSKRPSDDEDDSDEGYGYDDGVDVDHGYSYGSDSCSSSYGSSGGERQTTLDEFD